MDRERAEFGREERARLRTPLVAAAVLALFGAWLALPRPVAADERRELCLVDVSASVRRTRPDWAAWVGARIEEFARDAAARGAHTWVVAVANGQRQLAPREDARALLGRVRSGQLVDVAPAGLDPFEYARRRGARRGREWLVGGRGGRVLWLGDGDVQDDPVAASERLARLAGLGVGCDLVEPPPPSRPDVRISRLDAPSTIDAGAPLAVRVEVESVVPADAVAELTVEVVERVRATWSSTRAAPRSTSRGGRTRTLTTFDALGTGVWIVRARVSARSDGVPENDVEESVCRVGGGLAGEVVARDVDLGTAVRLARALELALPGTGFSAATVDGAARLLPHCDVVVTLDVAPSELPVGLLEPFVRAGGGLLVLGEVSQHVRSSRGVGVDLLPLVCAPPGIESRDVVLLLDGSGSMEGEPFDAVRVAARDILLATPPGDGFQVEVFTDGLVAASPDIRADEEVDLRAQRNVENWLAQLEAPGGKTSIVRTLEQWCRRRRAQLERDGERAPP
ncbi:MAG: hypothetical protein R3F34_10055 [Planctomycetota bacterium]